MLESSYRSVVVYFGLAAEVKLSAKILVESLGIDLAYVAEHHLLLRRKLYSHLAYNVFCDFSLELKDIAKITLVSVSPHISIRNCLSQLHRYSHPAARTNNRTRKHCINVQFAAYLFKGFPRPLILHH